MRLAHACSVAAAAAATCLLAASAFAQTPNRGAEVIAVEQARVTGDIVAEFGSRRLASNTGTDIYTINSLKVADLMVLGGSIQRTPEKSLSYSVKFDVFNPKQPGQLAKDVAIMRGDILIDEYGRYNPVGGNLRIDVVKGAQSTSAFKGAMRGRDVTRWWEFGEQLKKAQKDASKVYSRVVDGKTVMIEVKNPDPLGFDGLVLAGGPFSYLPETAVRGSLDYDYELGNWLTDNNGITLSYQLGDKPVRDRITGSIRFAETAGDATVDGKKVPYTGYYEYNLRFNEDAVKADTAFFDGESSNADQDAFFSSSDQSKAGLYGKVYFQDFEDNCKMVKDETQNLKCMGPTKSIITYDLKATSLTYAQLAAWMKIEQFVIGPFTDE